MRAPARVEQSPQMKPQSLFALRTPTGSICTPHPGQTHETCQRSVRSARLQRRRAQLAEFEKVILTSRSSNCEPLIAIINQRHCHVKLTIIHKYLPIETVPIRTYKWRADKCEAVLHRHTNMALLIHTLLILLLLCACTLNGKVCFSGRNE